MFPFAEVLCSFLLLDGHPHRTPGTGTPDMPTGKLYISDIDSMYFIRYTVYVTQVLNENARKPLSIGYLAFSLCSDILAALSVF